jgi:hypothetical protein
MSVWLDGPARLPGLSDPPFEGVVRDSRQGVGAREQRAEGLCQLPHLGIHKGVGARGRPAIRPEEKEERVHLAGPEPGQPLGQHRFYDLAASHPSGQPGDTGPLYSFKKSRKVHQISEHFLGKLFRLLGKPADFFRPLAWVNRRNFFHGVPAAVPLYPSFYPRTLPKQIPDASPWNFVTYESG